MDLETSKAASGQLPQATPDRAVPLIASDFTESASVPERHSLIKSEEAGVQLNLSELWSYRELLYFLTIRDIKVRYKQTLMGVAWVIIQPLATVLIFTLVSIALSALKPDQSPTRSSPCRVCCFGFFSLTPLLTALTAW